MRKNNWTSESLAETAAVVGEAAAARLLKMITDELVQIGNRAGKQHNRDLDFILTLVLRLRVADGQAAAYAQAEAVAAERARVRRELHEGLLGTNAVVEISSVMARADITDLIARVCPADSVDHIERACWPE